jgi:hypothetical protein
VRVQRKLNSAIIHIYFEMAIIGAIRTKFGIEPPGCVFHFCRPLMRYVAADGLLASYNTNNPDMCAQDCTSLIMSLPLVPPFRIGQAFLAVVNSALNVFGMDATAWLITFRIFLLISRQRNLIGKFRTYKFIRGISMRLSAHLHHCHHAIRIR